jgi:hypothetical protein
MIKINCRSNDQGWWCADKRVKRSLLGLGARMCRVANGESCPFQEPVPRPEPPKGCGPDAARFRELKDRNLEAHLRMKEQTDGNRRNPS